MLYTPHHHLFHIHTQMFNRSTSGCPTNPICISREGKFCSRQYLQQYRDCSLPGLYSLKADTISDDDEGEVKYSDDGHGYDEKKRQRSDNSQCTRTKSRRCRRRRRRWVGAMGPRVLFKQVCKPCYSKYWLTYGRILLFIFF
jgi:hypothetical protein